MRDNEKRVKSNLPDEDDVEKEVEKEQEAEDRKRQNPLDALDVKQNEFVELPSKGRYYSEDSPLHGREEVEVREMTAKEEDILSSRSLVQQGKAINRVLDAILEDPMLNHEYFIGGDKNALVIHARVSAYGPHYEVEMQCPICFNHQKLQYDIEEEAEVDEGGPSEKFPAEYQKESNTFLIELPKTEVEAEFRLLTGRDSELIQKAQQKKDKHNIQTSNMAERLKQIIVSLNGHTKNTTIEQFISEMPARDSKYLRSAYQSIQPSKEMVTDFQCKRCSYRDELNVPLRPKFFWPD